MLVTGFVDKKRCWSACCCGPSSLICRAVTIKMQRSG